MKTLLLAATAALLLAVPCLGGGSSNPADVEATFDSARLADDLSGTISDPAKEVDIDVYVSSGSKVSATFSAGTTGTVPTLKLCDAAGVDQQVAGSSFDKSVAGSNVVKWKNVPLQATGTYTFVLKLSAADAWRLTLKGSLATIKQTFLSTTNLGVNAQTQVAFNGLRGGKLSYTLAAAQSSKFKGNLVSVIRPDGSTIAGTPTTASGKVTLDQDGVHQLVFVNVGSGIGAWKATTTVTPPALVVRRGYVISSATTAFVPTVSSVSPPRDYQKDDASAVTISGKNFQPGVDVRLVRSGFQDIVATSVNVVSETQIQCVLNLATAPITGVDSLGTWKVGVWNNPVYTAPGDPLTLVKDSPTKNTSKTFDCLAASSISLPPGVMKNTEVWHLAFNSDFQEDLNRMGLGSSDSAIADAARTAVQAYTVCYLRELFHVNETNGNLAKNTSPAVSFVVASVPNPAGKPGVDYNRLEIGGAWQSGDPQDSADTLFWGYSPLDTGNTHRDNLSVSVDNGTGGTTRIGYGARTRVLDPTAATAAASWVAVTAPLRQVPLGTYSSDGFYFRRGFSPSSAADANRYRDVVQLVSRAAREIAAICAHHIGRAMGLSSNGTGPMDDPATAGNMWLLNGSLSYVASDVATLRANAAIGTLPGNSKALVLSYFPLVSSMTPYIQPDCYTGVPYSISWNYVGGRANALVTDYSVAYSGGNRPLGLTVSYQGLSGTAPLYIDPLNAQFHCDIAYFRVTCTDTVRNIAYQFIYRLNVLPTVSLLRPGNEQNQATNCKNAILATP
jgi:hypothetical protein